jgi:hypothetical protein
MLSNRTKRREIVVNKGNIHNRHKKIDLISAPYQYSFRRPLSTFLHVFGSWGGFSINEIGLVYFFCSPSAAVVFHSGHATGVGVKSV